LIERHTHTHKLRERRADTYRRTDTPTSLEP
jgi:hypothetical protein